MDSTDWELLGMLLAPQMTLERVEVLRTMFPPVEARFDNSTWEYREDG